MSAWMCPAAHCALYQLPVSTCDRQYGFLPARQCLETTPAASQFFSLSTRAAVDKFSVLRFSLCPTSCLTCFLLLGPSWFYGGSVPCSSFMGPGMVWHSVLWPGLPRQLSLLSRYQETQCSSASCCPHRPGCPSPLWTSALCFQGVQGLTV